VVKGRITTFFTFAAEDAGAVWATTGEVITRLSHSKPATLMAA
jgi:hypothetical protein